MIENCMNPEKLNRAKLVVERPALQAKNSAEAKAFAQGTAQKLTGEELVVFVYKAIGGLVADDVSSVAGADKETAAKVVETAKKTVAAKRKK